MKIDTTASKDIETPYTKIHVSNLSEDSEEVKKNEVPDSFSFYSGSVSELKENKLDRPRLYEESSSKVSFSFEKAKASIGSSSESVKIVFQEHYEDDSDVWT